jgi:hypothetical protein
MSARWKFNKKLRKLDKLCFNILMEKTSATSLELYLKELPEERRKVVSAVRDLVLRSLPEGYQERWNGGMFNYEVPLERYPNTYNGQPLSYVALAAQKNYFSLYLMCVYQDPGMERWLKEGFQKAGKKLDMGKSCLHFRSLDDLPLDLIAELIASVSPDQFIARYEAARKHKQPG